MRNASLGLAALVVLGITLAKQMQDRGPKAPSPVSETAQASVAADRRAEPTPAPTDAAASVELDVDISKSSMLPRLLYGFNTNNITGDYGYSDPAFQSAVADLSPGLLRFPGGSVANFYHWQTGKFEVGVGEEETGTKLEARTAGNMKRLEEKRGGVVAFSDFVALCNRNHVDPIIVVNAYTGTPEESAAWVREAKAKGFAVRGWEIGNELYLPAYKDRYPNVTSYIDAAKKHVAAMKAADPTIKVGVPATPAGFHSEREGEKSSYEADWDRALGKETFYDGVVVHLYTYTKVGRKNTGHENMRGYLFGSSEIGLKNAISYYRGYYGSKRLWITEWNLANPKNSIANTQLHAVYAGDFMLGLLQAEAPIRIAAYHVLAGSGKGFPLISPADQGDASSGGDVKRTAYFAFKVFGDAFAASDRQLPVAVKRAPTLMGSMDYEGQRMSGVRAGAFANDTTVTVMVSNRTESDQGLALTLSGKPVTGNVCWEAVANPDLAATNGGNASIRGDGQNDVDTRTWCGSAAQVTLPANSFLALKIPNVKVPRPPATAADSAMVE